jgi:site-specific DNA recombinase
LSPSRGGVNYKTLGYGHRAEYDQLQNRIDAMSVHKLDGRVDAAFFERISTEWRTEQERCQREIHRHQSAEQSHMNEGVQLIVRAARTARTAPLIEIRD